MESRNSRSNVTSLNIEIDEIYMNVRVDFISNINVKSIFLKQIDVPTVIQALQSTLVSAPLDVSSRGVPDITTKYNLRGFIARKSSEGNAHLNFNLYSKKRNEIFRMEIYLTSIQVTSLVRYLLQPGSD
jgi:hypothetical protein